MAADTLETCGLVKAEFKVPLLCCWGRPELPREFCPYAADTEVFWPTPGCRGRWACPLVACGGGWVTMCDMPEAMPYRLLCGRLWEPENWATARSCWPELEGREETEVCPGPIGIRFPGWENTRGQLELEGPKLFIPGTVAEDPRR